MTFTDDKTYTLSVAPNSIQADPSGEWDWLVSAPTAELYLQNITGTPWYSPCTETVELPSGPTEFLMKVRLDRYPQTNAATVYLEFEITARSASFYYHANFAGTASVTDVPESEDTVAYTKTTGSLNSAALEVGVQATVRLATEHAGSRSARHNRDLITLAVSGCGKFDVAQIAPDSVTINCIPPVAIELTRPHGRHPQELLATFDRDAILRSSPTASKRAIIALHLRGQLLNSTPVFGEAAIGYSGRIQFHQH